MYGYMGRIARVDLSTREITYEFPEEKILRQYYGGLGLGSYYLYRDMPKDKTWSDPENMFMLMTGPLTGAPGPTGLMTIVSMGAKTKNIVGAQCAGKSAPFLKFCGYDGLIIEGKSKTPVYLHITEDNIEFREAGHLMGLDTWQTTDKIEEEIGQGEDRMSVLAIGPAGENLVLMAAVCNEKGHIAAHNGPGAVMGSKNLKAVAIERGSKHPEYPDIEELRQFFWSYLSEKSLHMGDTYKYGTSTGIVGNTAPQMVPVKNYLNTDAEKFSTLSSRNYNKFVEREHLPCWGCPFRHCYRFTIVDGPFKGEVGDEMEYEVVAAMGSVCYNDDPMEVQMLGNQIDKLGMDGNEMGWIIGWLMECYERGICTKEDLDGIEMKWGDYTAQSRMLRKIAYRDGKVADACANGLTYAAQNLFDGKGEPYGVFTYKGNTPRGHDHRHLWNFELDTATGAIGTDEIGVLFPNNQVLGVADDVDRNTPDGCAEVSRATFDAGVKTYLDSFICCYFGLLGATQETLRELINIATGWDIDTEEITTSSRRISTLNRCFSILHGGTCKELEKLSERYGSKAIQGAAKGAWINQSWDEVLDKFYKEMEWDVETGKPTPELLKRVGLEYVIEDLWGEADLA